MSLSYEIVSRDVLSEEWLRERLADDFKIFGEMRNPEGKLVHLVLKPIHEKTPELLKDGVEFGVGSNQLYVRVVASAFTDLEMEKLMQIIDVVALKLGAHIVDPQIGLDDIEPSGFTEAKFFDFSIAGKTVSNEVIAPEFVNVVRNLGKS